MGAAAPRSALVTGAAGFVGSNLVARLLSDGWTVRALVRNVARDRSRLPASVELWEGDLATPKTLRGIGEGVDVVFHAAAQVDVPGTSARTYHRVNVEGTAALIEATAHPRLSRFVSISSIMAMGIRNAGRVDETTPCHPDLEYGRSKLEVERLLVHAWQARRFPAVVVRPPTVYGPGEHSNFLALCRAIRSGRFLLVGSGQNRIDFCWIGNLVQVLLRAAERGRPGQVYLVADQPPRPFAETVHVIARAVGRPPWPVRLPTPLAYALSAPLGVAGAALGWKPPLYPRRVRTMASDLTFDVGKAQQELGYEPEGPFEALCRQTVDWYRSHGVL